MNFHAETPGLDMAWLGEFELIRRVFAPLSFDVCALGLLDDAAVIAPKEGHATIISTDTLVEGVHFFPFEKPEIIARRLLRVNLSDIASMGAQPSGYLINLTLAPWVNDDWIIAFAEGLRSDQEEFGISLLGGDTVRTPGPLTLSVTMLGELAAGTAVLRSTANTGHAVFVSGTIGDAGLGMLHLKQTKETDHPLVCRYQLPQPRIQLGQALREIASSMIDVSDGLVSDLQHICAASAVGATIYLDDMPVSAAAKALLGSGDVKIEDLITSGDDYELIFTAPRNRLRDVLTIAETTRIAVTKIGVVDDNTGAVKVINSAGTEVKLDKTGYTHR